MAVILGVDPGSRKTGFGVINTVGDRCEYLASGVIHVADYEFPERMKQIYSCLQTIIHEHTPQAVVIEQIFLAKNASSALKLGHARGVVMAAAAMADVQVHEYSARQIKLAVVGSGAAQKTQVQHMVKVLLNLDKTPQEDAADALATAVCHAHTMRTLIRMAGARPHYVKVQR